MFVRGNDALEEIEKLVETQDVSLLVIGLRKRSAVGKLLLGSMAHDILMSVPCPVLAVESRGLNAQLQCAAARIAQHPRPATQEREAPASRYFAHSTQIYKNLIAACACYV